MRIFPDIKGAFMLWLARKTEDCKTIVPLFSSALDRRPSLTERIRLRLHLFTCTACLNYASNLRFMHEAFRAREKNLRNENTDVSLSPESKERIKKALKSRI